MKEPIKYSYKTTPFAHQKRALNKIRKLRGVSGLFMEMGTGKTKVAIDWASICHINGNLRRVVVVCPVSVLRVWKREIRKHSPVPARIAILQGPVAERIRFVELMRRNPKPDGIEWIIVNYEAVWRENSKGISLEDTLKKWKPQLVIADESHRIKSATSKQSRALARVGSSTPMRLALTGTPITKSPLDLFGQFRFLNPKIFGTNWSGYKNRYGIWGGYQRYQLRGYKNIPELVEKVKAHSFRIKKDQCLDLPEKIFEDVPIELSPKAQKIYKQMTDDMIAFLEDSGTEATAPIVLTKLLRLSQITSGFLKDVEGNIIQFDDTKLRVATDLIEDMVDQDEKVVVFTRFRHDYQSLSASLAARRIKSVLLSGSVPASKRDSIVEQFRNDSSTKVFISQIASGSLGIDLTAASLCIFYSYDYRWDHYVQAVDRIHRHGQTRTCNYYHLVVPGSIDSITLSILKEKGNIAEAVIHNPDVLRPSF